MQKTSGRLVLYFVVINFYSDIWPAKFTSVSSHNDGNIEFSHRRTYIDNYECKLPKIYVLIRVYVIENGLYVVWFVHIKSFYVVRIIIMFIMTRLLATLILESIR